MVEHPAVAERYDVVADVMRAVRRWFSENRDAEASIQQLADGLREMGAGARWGNVRAAAFRLVEADELEVRRGPRQALLFRRVA